MNFSNWKHHVLKPVTFCIHFVASTCTAFSLYTSHAELLLRFLLNPHNIFFAIRILTAAGSEALPDQSTHSRHQLKQHPGQVIQFQIPKNYLLVESSQTQEENTTKSAAKDLVSQQEDKESVWLISIMLSLKQPHRNRTGHEFSVRRIVEAHQILKSTADVCSPF